MDMKFCSQPNLNRKKNLFVSTGTAILIQLWSFFNIFWIGKRFICFCWKTCFNSYIWFQTNQFNQTKYLPHKKKIDLFQLQHVNLSKSVRNDSYFGSRPMPQQLCMLSKMCFADVTCQSVDCHFQNLGNPVPHLPQKDHCGKKEKRGAFLHNNS